MLKSFCVKTNNKKILNCLLKSFKQNTPNNFYLSKKSFKIYENVIFHYTGEHAELFYDYIANLLTDIILNFYESKLIKKIINFNYFYFSESEKKQIYNLCIESLAEYDNFSANSRSNIIFYLLKEYIIENKCVILDGFINFRLKEYIKILDEVVETCVKSYIIAKEYTEFINLLKIYINSNSSSNEVVHLIYFNQESILLDNNKKIINFNYDISNTKYLSDISFSTNDFCLNTLLNILPKKIYIHLLDGNEDEFIKTLSSIFESRISFCNNCNLCSYYKEKHIIQKNK